MKKLSNTEAELKKIVAYKKACILKIFLHTILKILSAQVFFSKNFFNGFFHECKTTNLGIKFLYQTFFKCDFLIKIRHKQHGSRKHFLFRKFEKTILYLVS